MAYKNKTDAKAYQARWYEENKELHKARTRAWKKAHPDKVEGYRKARLERRKDRRLADLNKQFHGAVGDRREELRLKIIAKLSNS